MLIRLYENLSLLGKWTRADALLIDQHTDGLLSEKIDINLIPEIQSTVNFKHGIKTLKKVIGLELELPVDNIKRILDKFDFHTLEDLRGLKIPEKNVIIHKEVSDTGVLVPINILDELIPFVFEIDEFKRNPHVIVINRYLREYKFPLMTLNINKEPKTLRNIYDYFTKENGINEYISLYKELEMMCEELKEEEDVEIDDHNDDRLLIHLDGKLALFLNTIRNPITKQVVELLIDLSENRIE